MLTQRLPSEAVPYAAALPRPGHPSDSSRVLLGLMELCQRARAEEDVPGDAALSGIISRGVLRSLLAALHYRDVGTVRHVRRVAQLALGMAGHLGWEGPHLKALEVAALLHDIGKIGVPDNILFKPGMLNPDEAELMALHHDIGLDVLQACRVGQETLDIVAQSHPRFAYAKDGTRRIGIDVHQGARILAVADAYDSLSNDQVYRSAKSHDEILKILTDGAGSRYDGNIVCALARWASGDGALVLQAAPQGDITASVSAQAPVDPADALAANELCHIFSYLYVLESLYDGFYLVDSDLRYVVWNRGAQELLGYPSGDMLGQVWASRKLNYADAYGQTLSDQDCPMKQVISEGKATSRTVRMRNADGDHVEVELQSVPLLDGHGRLHGVAEILRDLSRGARRPNEFRELKLAASRDPLTGIANRGELETQLALLVARTAKRTNDEPFSVIFLDVDFFKSINDTHGHGVGDQVLVELARLLELECTSGELVGRYGGEEFVILCPNASLAQATKRAERLRVTVAKSQLGGLDEFKVTASFGVASAEAGDSVEGLLRRADKALYRAKGTGRNRTCSFTAAELLGNEETAPQEAEATSEPFLLTARFSACVAADMVVYKLGGFVDDQKAKLVEVGPRRAVVRLGRGGLLNLWGGTDDRRPVEMQLAFGAEETAARGSRHASNRTVAVDVSIRPLGWVRNREAFRLRAQRVLKLLRSYFVVAE